MRGGRASATAAAGRGIAVAKLIGSVGDDRMGCRAGRAGGARFGGARVGAWRIGGGFKSWTISNPPRGLSMMRTSLGW